MSNQNSHFSVLGCSTARPSATGSATHRPQRRTELAREQAILAEQELQVAHELSTAIAEADRAYALTRTTSIAGRPPRNSWSK